MELCKTLWVNINWLMNQCLLNLALIISEWWETGVHATCYINSCIEYHLKRAFCTFIKCCRFGRKWLFTCVSVMWERMVMRGRVKSTMCCWQMESSQKWCETAGGKLCNPWKLSRNWAVKHGCSCGPMSRAATEDQGNLRQKPRLQEKMAPGVSATFLSEAASHWFWGAHH